MVFAEGSYFTHYFGTGLGAEWKILGLSSLECTVVQVKLWIQDGRQRWESERLRLQINYQFTTGSYAVNIGGYSASWKSR